MKKIAALFLCFILLAPTYSNSQPLTYQTQPEGNFNYWSALLAFYIVVPITCISTVADYTPLTERLTPSILYYATIGTCLGAMFPVTLFKHDSVATCIETEFCNQTYHAKRCVYSNEDSIYLKRTFNGALYGGLTGAVIGCFSYLRDKKPSQSIARIQKLETIPPLLHITPLEDNQEASEELFKKIRATYIFFNNPFVQAFAYYKQSFIRMGHIILYIEKARSNSPSKAQEETLNLSESKTIKLIEEINKALLLIKEHPDYIAQQLFMGIVL